MKTEVYIDTTSNQSIKVGFTIDEKEYLIEQPLNHQKAQIVLPLIEKIVKEHHLTLDTITDIKVSTGPGSFTGARVGLAIANTLGYLLKVPINGQPIGKSAEPIYAR